MINNISSNCGKQQVGFGMSQWKNLKLLIKSPKMTLKEAETIAKYLKEEAPKDGINIVMHIKKAPLETDNTTISAYATRKPVLFVNFLTDIQVNAAYDKLNPAAAFKNLLNDAVKALEKQEEKSALKKAKKKTFIG